MINKLELEIAIIKTGLTKTKVAKTLGLSRMAFYEKINNKKQFTLKEIKELCEILNLGEKERNKIFFNKDGNKCAKDENKCDTM